MTPLIKIVLSFDFATYVIEKISNLPRKNSFLGVRSWEGGGRAPGFRAKVDPVVARLFRWRFLHWAVFGASQVLLLSLSSP